MLTTKRIGKKNQATIEKKSPNITEGVNSYYNLIQTNIRSALDYRALFHVR